LRGHAGRRRRRHHHEGRGRAGADGAFVAAPRSRPRAAARARGASRPRRAPRRPSGRADADRLRGLCGAEAARRWESRLTPAAPAVVRAAARHGVRSVLGALFLTAATGFSLAIPWAVKHAIDTLDREGAAATLGRYVVMILVLAAGHWVTRLGSRFATIGAAQ